MGPRSDYIAPISETAIRGMTLDSVMLTLGDPVRIKVLGYLVAHGVLRSDAVMAALEADMNDRLTEAVVQFESGVGADR